MSMAFQEKDFQTKFNKWLKTLLRKKTAAFELKITRNRRLSYNSLEPHQELALFQATTSELIYKIPDTGLQNPFDSFILHQVPAYVVVMFRACGTQDEFVAIPIKVWLDQKQQAVEKSIPEDLAKKIGIVCSFKNPVGIEG